jgi:hypothetical protein
LEKVSNRHAKEFGANTHAESSHPCPDNFTHLASDFGANARADSSHKFILGENCSRMTFCLAALIGRCNQIEANFPP